VPPGGLEPVEKNEKYALLVFMFDGVVKLGLALVVLFVTIECWATGVDVLCPVICTTLIKQPVAASPVQSYVTVIDEGELPTWAHAVI
jgi:hypothetical protein